MRSLLLIRADAEPSADAAPAGGADAVLFDLTTSPGDAQRRRDIAGAHLLTFRKLAPRLRLYALIENVETASVEADLDSIMPAKPDGVILGQAQNGAALQQLSVKLAVREASLGIDDGSTRIIARAATTPAALFALGTYLGKSARLEGLIFGEPQLAKVLNIAGGTLPDDATSPLAAARTLTLLAAKAANIPAIDSASDEMDVARFTKTCIAARRAGFSGKLALHPAQVPIINSVFGNDEFGNGKDAPI